MTTVIDSLPSIILQGDTARARRSDRLTSHTAADISSRNIQTVKECVYRLIDLAGTAGMTGTELNLMYSAAEWVKPAAPDTPRKRIDDLVKDGLVFDSGSTRSGVFGSPETIWVSAPIAALMGVDK